MIALRIMLVAIITILASLIPSWPTGDGLPAGPRTTTTAKPAAVKPPAEITPAPAKRLQLPVAANSDRAAAQVLGVDLWTEHVPLVLEAMKGIAAELGLDGRDARA